MDSAEDPEIRIIPIPLLPMGDAIAAMVSYSMMLNSRRVEVFASPIGFTEPIVGSSDKIQNKSKTDS
jgi:hypothetical protein